ncbi:hypothetical protein TURU_035598 [Turdus rufiventris]|nr:hypothetical protein TURU_035598 [Turdus rufiventris]
MRGESELMEPRPPGGGNRELAQMPGREKRGEAARPRGSSKKRCGKAPRSGEKVPRKSGEKAPRKSAAKKRQKITAKKHRKIAAKSCRKMAKKRSEKPSKNHGGNLLKTGENRGEKPPKSGKKSRRKVAEKRRKIAAKCSKTEKNRREKAAKKQQKTLQIENLPVIRYFVAHRAAPHCKKIVHLIVRCALSELQSCESRGGVRLIVRCALWI